MSSDFSVISALLRYAYGSRPTPVCRVRKSIHVEQRQVFVEAPPASARIAATSHCRSHSAARQGRSSCVVPEGPVGRGGAPTRPVGEGAVAQEQRERTPGIAGGLLSWRNTIPTATCSRRGRHRPRRRTPCAGCCTGPGRSRDPGYTPTARARTPPSLVSGVADIGLDAPIVPRSQREARSRRAASAVGMFAHQVDRGGRACRRRS